MGQCDDAPAGLARHRADARSDASARGRRLVARHVWHQPLISARGAATRLGGQCTARSLASPATHHSECGGAGRGAALSSTGIHAIVYAARLVVQYGKRRRAARHRTTVPPDAVVGHLPRRRATVLDQRVCETLAPTARRGAATAARHVRLGPPAPVQQARLARLVRRHRRPGAHCARDDRLRLRRQRQRRILARLHRARQRNDLGVARPRPPRSARDVC